MATQVRTNEDSIELDKNRRKLGRVIIDILPGAPKLQSLWSFRRKLERHRGVESPSLAQSETTRQPAVHKGCVDVGHELENVAITSAKVSANSCERTQQLEPPTNILVSTGPTHPTLIREGATRSNEGESKSQSAKVELPPQCEAETRNATEMSGALAVPTSSAQFGKDPIPTTTAPATKSKGKGPEFMDVQVHLTIKERLERLEFASKVGLKADKSANFSEEEVRKLRQFTAEYDLGRQKWFRGKRGPTITFKLVALSRADGMSSEGAEARTGIAITGLPSEGDIREFHKVMSKTIIRDLYSPLRLCYDTALIQRPSRMVLEDYVYSRPEPFETLCGTHITTRRPQDDREWTSTLGGIIEVNGNLFVITTSHTPDDVSKPAGLNLDDVDHLSSLSSKIIEAEYALDVKSALILDEPAVDISRVDAFNHMHSSAYPMSKLPTRHPACEEGKEGEDWRLIPISKEYCFPNLFRSASQDFGIGSSTEAEQATQYANATFITGYEKSPSRRIVQILVGSDREPQGTLASSPAFLSMAGGPAREIWTVSSTDPALENGDSGSWVVDGSGELIGMVTAMSSKDVYVTPFCLQAKEIQRAQYGRQRVTLPSPLKCVLELAAAESSEFRPSSIYTSKYISDVLSPQVLNASKGSDRLAATLIMAQELDMFIAPENVAALKYVLYKEGNRVRSVLEGRLPLPHPNSGSIKGNIMQKLSIIYQALVDVDLTALLLNSTRAQSIRDDVGQKLSLIDSARPGNASTTTERTAQQGPVRFLFDNTDIEAARNSADLITSPAVDNSDQPVPPTPTAPTTQHHDRTLLNLQFRYQFLVFILVVTAMSIVGSICAAVVLGRMEEIQQSSVVKAAVVVGATLAAPVIIRSPFKIPTQPVLRPFVLDRGWRWNTGDFFAFLRLFYPYVIHFISTLVRPAFAALAGTSILSVNDTGNRYGILFISGLAAGAPYTADITLYHYLRLGRPGIIRPFLLGQKMTKKSCTSSCLNVIYCTGRDSLAAFAFVRVTKSQGVYVASDGAAALAGGVFAVIYILSRPLVVLCMWYLSRRYPKLLIGYRSEQDKKRSSPIRVIHLVAMPSRRIQLFRAGNTPDSRRLRAGPGGSTGHR